MLEQLLLQMLSWSEDNTKALVRFFGTAHQRYVSVLCFYFSPVIFLDRHARITQRTVDSKLNQSFNCVRVKMNGNSQLTLREQTPFLGCVSAAAS